ncbi:MAG TPA: ABC transporter permease [Terriglobales bacterium]
MRWQDKLRLRLRSLFARNAVEQELDAELRFHLEEQIAENVASGMSAEEARSAALRTIGGLTQIAEDCRDARSVGAAESLAQDVRFGARMLVKNPGFTAAAVLTLAIGIGFNTLAFSAINALLLGSLPVTEPDRLVLGEALRDGFDPAGTSLVQFAALQKETKAFSTTGLSLDQSFLLRGKTEAEQLRGAVVTPGFFETLGATPILGRGMSREESRPGGPPVVVLAYDLWQSRFGGARDLIGESVDMDGQTYTIIGVMPRGFDYPSRTQAWVAMQVDPETAPAEVRNVHGNIFVAWLRYGVSFRQADAAMKRLAKQVQEQFPQTERGWSYGLLTMRQWSLGDDDGRTTKAIVVLVVAVGLLLLICCVNVANLLLLRGVARERELAIRVALGASSWRVARQLLTEGLVLSGLGGAAGFLFAYALRPVLRVLNPIEPHSFSAVVTDIQIDARVLAFCAGIALLSGVIFSLAPAFRLAFLRDPLSTLRQREHRTGGTATRRGWLRALVVAEIAIAVALTFGGALLTKSFYRLGRLDLGFRPDHLLTMQLPLSASEYPRQEQKVAFADRLVERVQSLPGVLAAGLTTNLPMQQFSRDTYFTVEGHPISNTASEPLAALRCVSPGYAETLGLTLVKGRFITRQDRADTLRVAVISEELARQGFGNEDPIGKHIRRGRRHETSLPWLVVVGVVRDAKEDRYNFRIARPILYVPIAQQIGAPSRGLTLNLVVRTTADPASLTASVRSTVHELNLFQPLVEVSSMDAMLGSVLSSDRFSARVMAMLAIVGLFLASIGLYSVIAYSVTQRTGEIGLRMALGAQPSSIFVLIAREGSTLVALGLALALPGMITVALLLSGVLFAVRAVDPAILLGIAVLLITVAFMACLMPTRRAIRLDPVQALRDE